ncbi:hypothetical protein VF13_40525 [Nostoc linckia z16]|nr:hypothetical protein VF12_40240 [Nostoc linckia z15]PHK28799.1 hypothetical protein VF13_40525 [Nostoc linckia z16]
MGLSIKGGGMIISLLLVPMTIDYLSPVTYGTWLTISSIVTMLTFFDVGIGNGLRNKLSEAIAKQNAALAQSYVSTAYVVFGGLQAALALLFVALYKYIPWSRILNTSIDIGQLQTVILITVIAMAMKLVLDILSYVLLAIQESSLSGLLLLLSNVSILGCTYALKQYSHGNLVLLATVTAFSPIAVLLVAGLVLYRGRLKAYRPTLRMADMRQTKDLLQLGYKFFVIQLAVLVIFYTDNLIINQLFGPLAVTNYNIAFRYFNAINTIFAIAITPYWSAFTEAYVKHDSAWMLKTYRYLQRLWLLLVVVVAIMIFSADKVYAIWVGDRINVPFKVSLFMGLFTVISCWNNVTVAVVNGVGKVRLQLYYSLISAVINIPLAILFGQTLGLGSAGVVMATCVSLSIGSLFGAIQAERIIKGTATGIWNR